MKTLAKERGGKCLSIEYINSQTRLLWRCEKGHEWQAVPADIRRGRWCGKCKRRGQSGKYTIQELQALAKSRGGKCLSKEHKHQRTKLRWRCAHGHEWEARPGGIINQGQWCPACTTGIGERITRAYFEQLFKKKFPSVRPKFLEVESGRRLQLDGYCKSLKLAFEHQGMHHYESARYGVNSASLANKTHKTTKLFDKIKKERCEELGVTLIEVPEIPRLLKVADLRSFLAEQCLASDFKLPSNFDKIEIDLRDAYSASHQIEMLNEMRQIAKERKGLCLSTEYLRSNSHLSWECHKGHQWKATPASIKHALSWCPKCTGRARLEIEEIKSLAREKGGECLSKEYINSKSHLLWRCNKGHEWKAAPGGIRGGSWCPECVGVKRLTIETAREAARKKGGECLSKAYKNKTSKLKWRCELGHEWKAALDQVKNAGSWCPQCAGKKPHTIKHFQELATSRGGKILSKKYLGLKIKHKWKCSVGHEWEAAPGNIKYQNQWCPECGGRKKLTIELMEQIAESKGGLCLSKKYINQKTKLKWRCSEGHEWIAAPANIHNQNQWCPECSGSKKLSIELAREIASKRGGMCLSDTYKNSKAKLKWRCEKGHQWESALSNVKNSGSWCPKCSYKNRN